MNLRIFLFCAIALLGIQSCNQCEDVICPARSQCISGNCFCQDGYEGADCNTLAVNKYIGNYQVSPSCQQGFAITHFSSIYDNSIYVNGFFIGNFLGSGIPVEAFIGTDANNQGNLIVIPEQNLGAIAVLGGEGFYDSFNGRIIITVQYVQNGQGSICTFTYF